MKYLILMSAVIALAGLANDAQGKGLAMTGLQGNQAVSAPGYEQTSQSGLQTDITFLPDQPAQVCPAFCISPVAFNGDVHTMDAQGLLKFMRSSEKNGHGVIVDTRSPGWYQRGTIPNAVNIPYTVFEKSDGNAQLAQVFEKLGVRPRHHVSLVLRMFERLGLFGGKLKTAHWDFTHARDIALVCNDPWCRQSPRAIKALLAQGYPAEKLYYYRGGLQAWQSQGLTMQIPEPDRIASR